MCSCPTVVCIFKTGKWINTSIRQTVAYDARHVRWIQAQIKAHVTVPHQFVCLTDSEELGDIARPLAYHLPGWWSKMELFRPDLGLTNALYLDLDMVIIRNIDPFLEPAPFRVLRNMSKKPGGISSALMRWEGDHSYLFEKFMERPGDHMDTYSSLERWGDQAFIQDHLPGIDFFQDRFPGAVKSFVSDLKRGDPDDHTRIVDFHGRYNPWDVNRSWIPNLDAVDDRLF